MRIRGQKISTDNSVSISHQSSSSSNSSSITASHSLASSQDSSSHSSPISILAAASHRYHGLDLLVKAIHQVTAGSVVGVPYIQRRVTIRRRRRTRGLEFDPFVFEELPERKRERAAKKVISSKCANNSKIKKTKKGKTLVGVPTRVQDSVLQAWVRRSGHGDEMGL